jgi:hypothetical protein
LRSSLPWRDLLAAGRPPLGLFSNQEITPPSIPTNPPTRPSIAGFLLILYHVEITYNFGVHVVN